MAAGIDSADGATEADLTAEITAVGPAGARDLTEVRDLTRAALDPQEEVAAPGREAAPRREAALRREAAPRKAAAAESPQSLAADPDLLSRELKFLRQSRG